MDRINRVHGAMSKLGPEYSSLKNKVGDLKGKTIIITGASRGIGLGIGLRAAKDGANVVILAKSDRPHNKLDGTIYTAAEEMRALGGKVLPLKCDIRNDESVKECIEKAVEVFGGIDIVINNASSLNLTPTDKLDIKK